MYIIIFFLIFFLANLRFFISFIFNNLHQFLCEAAGWPGVDPGGLLQRPRAAAAGLGDLRLPGLLPPLLRLPHAPRHRPGGPHHRQLGLLGKLQTVPQPISIFLSQRFNQLFVLQLSSQIPNHVFEV